MEICAESLAKEARYTQSTACGVLWGLSPSSFFFLYGHLLMKVKIFIQKPLCASLQGNKQSQGRNTNLCLKQRAIVQECQQAQNPSSAMTDKGREWQFYSHHLKKVRVEFLNALWFFSAIILKAYHLTINVMQKSKTL